MSDTTKRHGPIERARQQAAYDAHTHVVTDLRCLIPYARDVGDDVADILLRVLASVERRRLERLPDITNEAEAA